MKGAMRARRWSIRRKVMEMRSSLTPGTQCLQTSAPAPSSTSTEPTGSAIEKGASNSPSERILMLGPKRMLCSETRESVTKGREKSWLSMCGGMQSPAWLGLGLGLGSGVRVRG